MRIQIGLYKTNSFWGSNDQEQCTCTCNYTWYTFVFLHFIGQIIPKICACMYLFIFLQYIVCTILKYGGGKNHRITQKINGM